jgi:hypothetical protein
MKVHKQCGAIELAGLLVYLLSYVDDSTKPCPVIKDRVLFSLHDNGQK